MRKFIVQRAIAGIGARDRAELQAGARASLDALNTLGPDIKWLHSYITNDHTYCVYLAADEAIIRKHAEISGFPATAIIEVTSILTPADAEPA